MERSVKVWLGALSILGVLLTYSYFASLFQVHFTCQTDGQRDDIFSYQNGLDDMFNPYQVRTMSLVRHEDGSLEVDAFTKQTLKDSCTRW